MNNASARSGASPVPSTDLSIHDVEITEHIDFRLDVAAGNYTKWRESFTRVLTRFNARDHVEREAHPGLAADEEWRAEDDTIVLWIYTTISDALQDAVMAADADGTAYAAWRHLRHFFTEIQAGRLAALLRNTVQWNTMTVEAYCGELKGIADRLADVGAPVSDRELTAQLVKGLDVGRFEEQRELLESMVPFPSFVDAQSRLQIAEDKLKAKENPRILRGSGAGSRFSGDWGYGQLYVRGGSQNGYYGHYNNWS